MHNLLGYMLYRDTKEGTPAAELAMRYGIPSAEVDRAIAEAARCFECHADVKRESLFGLFRVFPRRHQKSRRKRT